MSWLSKLLRTSSSAHPSQGKRRRSPVSRRLGLERLERREVFNVEFDSVLALSAPGISNAMDVATDSAGNQVITGFFQGTVDFDPAAVHDGDTDILTASGQNEVFLAKYAPDGSLLWATQMQGTAASKGGTARALTTDAFDNLYIAGDFAGTIDFGGTVLTSVNAEKDGFVAKISPAGEVLWAQRWGGAGVEYAYGITVDGNGNVFTTGNTNAYAMIQVQKFNASGALLWTKEVGNTTGGNSGQGLDTDAAGNVYICGSFRGAVDFNPGTGKKNVNGGAKDNGFVLKLTSAGNFGWVSTFANRTSSASNSCNDLVLDSSNNIVVGGSYRGSVDFNPGKATFSLPYTVQSGAVLGGGFLAKLNSSGGLVWASKVADSFASVASVALDAFGNVYATGAFQAPNLGTGTYDFDPGAGTNSVTCNGRTDFYVAKYSATGAYQWAVAFGGTGLEHGNGIALNSAGDIYVAGYFSGNVDFDPDPDAELVLTGAGDADGFLLKLGQI
jgi:hypothetical protein